MSCGERIDFEERVWWLADPLHGTSLNERRLEHYAREVNIRLNSERAFTISPRRNPRSLSTPGFGHSLNAQRRETHLMLGSDLAGTMPDTFEISSAKVQAPGPVGQFGITPESLPAPDSTPRSGEWIAGFLDRIGDALAWSNPLFHSNPWEGMERSLRVASMGAAPRSAPAARLQSVPDVAAVLSPFLAEPDHWDLQAERPVESSWSPIGPIVQLEHQHAFFRRGDSVRLALITDVSATPLFNGTLHSAELVRSRSPRSVPVTYRQAGGPRYEFSPLLPSDSMLLSLEVVALGRGGGRTRFGAVPRPRSAGNRIDISDILLLDASAGTVDGVANLDSALRHGLPTTSVTEKSALGLYWEVYGLVAGERPEIIVSAIRQPPTGFFARAIGGIFGGNSSGRALLISYPDVIANGDETESRTLTLDLSTLPQGSYVIEVRVELPGEPAAGTSRRMKIVPR
jgi:hypothetical protein